MTDLAHHDPLEPPAAAARRYRNQFPRFRALREYAWPNASYQLQPAFWSLSERASAMGVIASSITPATNCDSAENAPRPADVQAELRMLKQRCRQITGMAWTSRAVYLVGVATFAAYEQVARLMDCRTLLRLDSDYAEHRGKRIVAIVFCDKTAPHVAQFARRHRIRIVTQIADAPVDVND
jgi:hypothetical protein